MRYSVIVNFTVYMDDPDEWDCDEDKPSENEEFTKAQVEHNKPSFEFPGLEYTQFDDGTGCEYGSYDYMGVLGPKAMRKLMEELLLEVTDDLSMGTMGAPGCGIGVVPNIICRVDSDDGWTEAFITPIPTELETRKLDWEGAKEKLRQMVY